MERVGTLLTHASKHFDSSDYKQAVGYCLVAFEQLMSTWTAYNQRLFELREPPTDKFARIIGTLSAGVHLPSLRRFRDATDGIHGAVTQTGTVHLTYTRTLDNQVEMERRARYALDFVGGLALQIQARIDSGTGW